MRDSPTPNDVAATLAAFVDVLIPGDDVFPPASLVGAHGLVADKVRGLMGGEALAELTVALICEDLPLFAQAQDHRIHCVRRFETEQPQQFAFFRNVAYYMYYQSPPVTAAIRALGHVYNDSPQPRGYTLAPFDPTPGVDAPSAPRGSYKRTTDVTRIDVSELAVFRADVEGTS